MAPVSIGVNVRKSQVNAGYELSAFTCNNTLWGFAGKLSSAALDTCFAAKGTIAVLVSSGSDETECKLDSFQKSSLQVFLQNQAPIRLEVEKQLALDCSYAPREGDVVPKDVWKRIKGCSLRLPRHQRRTDAEIMQLCDAMRLKGDRRMKMETALRFENSITSLSELVVDVDWDDSHITVCKIVNGTLQSVNKE